MVGIALLLGLFTGIAAFFGAFMNENYLLPALGTPWSPGYIFESEPREPGTRTSPEAGLH